MSDTYLCNTCGRMLPLSCFYLRGKGDRCEGSPRHECKECHSKRGSAYYQKHKREHNIVSNRYHRRKFAFMTEERYQQLYSEQKGCCAICGKHESELNGKALCADHNHKTKIARGLLCSKCNSALGFLNDDMSVLKKAIDYLQKYEVQNVIL